MLLVRLTATSTPNAATAGSEVPDDSVVCAIEHSPDAFVVTDLEGRVISANASFVELVELARPDHVRGELLERWVGRSETDMQLMLTTLHQQGVLRLFASTLRGELGAQVEVSASTMPADEPPCIGFAIRHTGRRLGAERQHVMKPPLPVEEITRRVVRALLKDMVHESTAVIERMCIEEALRLTGNNRASAAQMLGLSRQGLYSKLHRYVLVERSSKRTKD